MKILIFIEHNSMIRHFIDSDAFSTLCSKHEVKFVLPFGHKRLGELKIEDLNLCPSIIRNLPVCNLRESLWVKDVEASKPLQPWTLELIRFVWW